MPLAAGARVRRRSARPASVVPDGATVEDPARYAAGPAHPPLPHTHGAVIIPAHDEAAVIGRALRGLAPLVAATSIEVIVVCNGCTDATASIARAFAWARVVEIPEASKPAALNTGDRLARHWPRLYLDADIEVTPQAVLRTFAALEEPGVLAARPFHAYDASEASAVVRSYYRARSRIPGPRLRLWGAGAYATHEAGHRRLGEFPEVTADDSWIDGQFADHEKRVVETPPMRVRTPRDTADLLRILTRQRRGYLELGIPPETGSRTMALITTVRGPRSGIDAICYLVLTLAARVRAERVLRRPGKHAWERDSSSRTDTEKAP